MLQTGIVFVNTLQQKIL